MTDYLIRKINPANKREMSQAEKILATEGLAFDQNLDYICGIFDEQYQVLGCGCCFKNTLRCIAVDHAHQGFGLMNQLITHLMQVQFDRGNSHIFVYTKKTTAKFFQEVGFYQIADVEDKLVFLENKKDGFQHYLDSLPENTTDGKIAAIVMNANPFTLGHLKLVEKAAAENAILYLFIVSADESLIPYQVRKELIIAGTSHLTNIFYVDTKDYLISTATFPSYFLKEEQTVIKTQAKLDAKLFTKIARHCKITRRYVGTEPFSVVTGIYNTVLAEVLTKNQLKVIEVPRFSNQYGEISASVVRQLLADDELAALKDFVPQTTWVFFESPAGKELQQKIKQADQIKHY